MKILITGACGQLGMSLRKVAGEYPAHDFVFTDLPDVDITDYVAMRELIGKVSPQVLINCAAFTNVERAETERGEAMKLNAEGPKILAGLAVEYGFRLIHFSTDYVFDGRAHIPYSESGNPAPLNFYGTSKLAGELEIAFSGADAIIIRTSWLYSEFGNNFVRTMLRLAGEGREIKVVDDQTGSPTYAADLARATLALLEKNDIDAAYPPAVYGSDSRANLNKLYGMEVSDKADGLVGAVDFGGSNILKVDCNPDILGMQNGAESRKKSVNRTCRLYNYCGSGAVTWYGFAEKIFSLAGVSAQLTAVNSHDYASAALRPAYSVLDTSLAGRAGLEMRPWEEALEKMLESVCANFVPAASCLEYFE